jgi:hypothetical protein
MDTESEKRTLVTGAAFKLLVHWLRTKECRCENRRKYDMETPCWRCKDVEQFKQAFPLEFGAACEFVVLNKDPKDTK